MLARALLEQVGDPRAFTGTRGWRPRRTAGHDDRRTAPPAQEPPPPPRSISPPQLLAAPHRTAALEAPVRRSESSDATREPTAAPCCYEQQRERLTQGKLHCLDRFDSPVRSRGDRRAHDVARHRLAATAPPGRHGQQLAHRPLGGRPTTRILARHPATTAASRGARERGIAPGLSERAGATARWCGLVDPNRRRGE